MERFDGKIIGLRDAVRAETQPTDAVFFDRFFGKSPFDKGFQRRAASVAKRQTGVIARLERPKRPPKRFDRQFAPPSALDRGADSNEKRRGRYRFRFLRSRQRKILSKSLERRRFRRDVAEIFERFERGNDPVGVQNVGLSFERVCERAEKRRVVLSEEKRSKIRLREVLPAALDCFVVLRRVPVERERAEIDRRTPSRRFGIKVEEEKGAFAGRSDVADGGDKVVYFNGLRRFGSVRKQERVPLGFAAENEAEFAGSEASERIAGSSNVSFGESASRSQASVSRRTLSVGRRVGLSSKGEKTTTFDGRSLAARRTSTKR